MNQGIRSITVGDETTPVDPRRDSDVNGAVWGHHGIDRGASWGLTTPQG